MNKLTSFLNNKIRCWSIISVVYKILFFCHLFRCLQVPWSNLGISLKWNNESQFRWKRNWVGVREHLALGNLEHCHPFYAERSGKFWWCFCNFLNVNLVSYDFKPLHLLESSQTIEINRPSVRVDRNYLCNNQHIFHICQ